MPCEKVWPNGPVKLKFGLLTPGVQDLSWACQTQVLAGQYLQSPKKKKHKNGTLHSKYQRIPFFTYSQTNKVSQANEKTTDYD